MEKQYLTPEEVAKRFKVISVRTLANWRSQGEGPAFTKIGGKVLYCLEEIKKWEKRRTKCDNCN